MCVCVCVCVCGDRALKKLWMRKLRPCLKKRCRGKVDDDVMEGPKPMPKDWEIEHMKPDLEDFTLAEYTEKVILYGFLMVNIAATSSLCCHFYLHRYVHCLLAPRSAHV